MPVGTLGQLISFGVERDEDVKLRKWIWVPVEFGDTVNKLAAKYAQPDDVHDIKEKNGIRSATQNLRLTLKERKELKKKKKPLPKNWQKIKVPGQFRPDLKFHVLAGEQPPRITDGYAKFSTVDRPERVGFARFDGYNPAVMEVPIQFEKSIAHSAEFRGGESMGFTAQDIERDIDILERMAGRGNFEGAGTGQPPIIRVSTTDADGRVIPLIPSNYQWSNANPSAPLWRVTGIEWDAAPIRDDSGRRTRQLATVTLTQFTKVSMATASLATRRKQKKKKKKKKK